MPTLPSPTPVTEYRVSGIVTDGADAKPIASATLALRHGNGELTTRTGADGSYVFSFRASQPYQSRMQVPDSLGVLAVRDGAHWGLADGGHWTTVQLLPWGTPDVVHNVRLRPVRVLTPGESMSLSVEPDSSLVWDRELDPWFLWPADTLTEEFVVSVKTDGVLTINARPESGGLIATLPCPYVGCPDSRVQGTISIPVVARWSPFYFSIEIPRASAPQRHEIQASLR